MHNESNQRCWAYLHNRLSETEQEAFLHELESSPDLAARLAELTEIHRLIREAEAAPETSDDELLDGFIRQYDEEHPEANPPLAKPEGKMTPFQTWSRLGMAVAACILALLAYQSTLPPSLLWSGATMGSVQTRDGAGPAASPYSEGQLLTLHEAIKAQLEDTLTEAREDGKLKLPRRVRIQARYNQTALGAVLVELEVTSGRRVLTVLNGEFDSLENAMRNIPELGTALLGQLPLRE